MDQFAVAFLASQLGGTVESAGAGQFFVYSGGLRYRLVVPAQRSYQQTIRIRVERRAGAGRWREVAVAYWAQGRSHADVLRTVTRSGWA